MSNKHEGCSRAFIQYSKTWYAKERKTGRREAWEEEVMFGFYDVDGGTSGEMAMRWYILGGGEPTPRLEAYCDAWDVLFQISDVIARMAEWDDKSPQPEDFVQILLECGFADRTPKHFTEDKY